MSFNPVVGLVASAVILAGALAFGTEGGERARTPGPTPTAATPSPEPLMAGSRAASAYVTYSTACRNPGNPQGVCWYEGWEFRKRTICLESTIPYAPLAETRRRYGYTGSPLSLAITNRAGGCRRAGFASSQTLVFSLFTRADHAGSMAGACAYTAPSNYGQLNSVFIRVRVTGTMRTACGGGAEWYDVFAHEFGHALGLSHRQRYASSQMRDGHSVSTQDRAELAWIYKGSALR